jgi:OFA family oxalate/formate antiporter-like MFS transporter
VRGKGFLVERGSSTARIPGVRRIRTVYYGNWLVMAAFIAQFVSVGSQNYVIGVFLKPMTRDLFWTRSEYTLARTLGQFVMAFTGVFVGGYVDRRGGRRLMTGGIVVLSLALFATAWVQSLWQWVLLNGIMVTVGASLVGSLVVNVMLSKWFVERRGRVVGTAAMGVSFAGIVLPWLMTQVVGAWGWRAAWQVLALGAAALVLPASLLIRRTPEDHGLHPDGKTALEVAEGKGGSADMDFSSSLTRREAMHTAAFYLIVVAFGLFGISVTVMLLQTIPYLTDAGYSSSTASLMITVTSIPALLTKPLWGYYIDRNDPNRLAAISTVINGVSLILVIVAVRAEMRPLVFFGFFALGCGWGGLIPLQEVVWASYFGRRYLGAVRSAALPLSLTLTASAPILTSLYYDRAGNYDGAFWAIAILSILAAGLMFVVRRPRRR